MDVLGSEQLREQAGVVARRQLLAAGASRHDVERALRRRDLTRVHPGVYVEHTGPLTWEQRAWAAVLVHEGAALAGASALRAWEVRTGAADDDADVELLVPRGRRVDDPPGVTTRVSRVFAHEVLGALAPPRQRLEAAVLDVASRRRHRPDDLVAVLADAVQARRTTAERLAGELQRRRRLPGRRLMGEVLEQVREGALSPLELRYLRDVERAHGLPPGRRQVRRTGAIAAYSDVRYAEQRVLVELDGRLGHTTANDRWRDLQRDLTAAGSGELTVRIGWRQVLAPCRLAGEVGALLQARGWDGVARCRTCDRGGTSAAGAEEPPRSA